MFKEMECCMMHNIKQCHNGKILFSLFILLLIVCCATTLAKKDKGIAEDTPQPCPICKPGTGLEKYCGIGYHGGTDQSCEPCKEGETYNEREGSYRCLPCQNCDRYSREAIYKCRESLNSKCGPCKTGYYSYQKYNRSIQSVRLESCSPCRGPEDHPDCFQHFTTMTVLSETTPEVKEHEDNRMPRIEIGTLVPILLIGIVFLLVIVLVISTVKNGSQPDRRDSISQTKAEMHNLLDDQNAGSDATADNDKNESKGVPDCRISMSDETSEKASQEKRKRGVASRNRSELPTKIAKKSPAHADTLRQKVELQKSPCAVDSRATESKIDRSYSGDRNKELEAVSGNSCHTYSIDRSGSLSTNLHPAPDSSVPQAEGINLNPTLRSSNIEVNEVVTGQYRNPEVNEVVTDHSSNPEANEVVTDQSRNPEVNEIVTDHSSNPEVNEVVTDQSRHPEVNEVVTDQSRNPDVNEDVNNRSFMSPPHSVKAPINVDTNTPITIIVNGPCQNNFNQGNNNTVHNAQNQGQFPKDDNNTNTRPTPQNCSSKQEDPGDQDKFPQPDSSVGPCECNTSPCHILQPQPSTENLSRQYHENPCPCNVATEPKIPEEKASQEKRKRGVASCNRSEPPTKIAKESPSHAYKLRQNVELQKSPCAVDSRVTESKIDLSYSGDGNKELEAVGGNSCHRYSIHRSGCPSTNRQPAPVSTGLQGDGVHMSRADHSSNLEVNEVVTDQSSNLDANEVVTDQSSNLEVNEVVTDQSSNPEMNEDVSNASFISPPHRAKALKTVDANTASDQCSSQPSSIPTNIINYNFHGNCQNVFNHGNSNTVHNAQNHGQFPLYDNTNTRPNCSSTQEDTEDQEKFAEPESNVGPCECECNTLAGHILQPQTSMEDTCSRCHEKACSCNVATEPKVPEDSTLTQTAQANVVSPQLPCDM